MTFLSANWLIALMGRLHPLMVHFPIGLLAGALLLESWNRWRKRKPDYSGMVYLGAATAILSAVMGLMLRQTEDYAGGLIDQHQWAGYITAVLSCTSAWLYRRQHRFAYLSLIVTGLSLAVTGHLGASLTHGADYLSSVLPGSGKDHGGSGQLQAFLAVAQGDSLPQDQLDRLNLEVRAIFAHNCYQCHSTEKRKGGWALDSKDGVFAGGEDGPILIAGKAAESEVIRRLELPRSDEDAMPPKGKVLQADEIKLIRLWIDRGAHWADRDLKVFREAEMALKQPQLPETPADITHPVDKFVHVYFEENDLDWPDVIDDRQFMRRAYLDITGLLPEPAAVEQFLADRSDNKREQLIKRLLDDQDGESAHVSRQVLASLLGMVPETLSRALARLRDDGAIDLTRTSVTVKDWARLEAEAR